MPDRLIPDATPARRTAVVACMDTRVLPLDALGYAPGDAHVLRTAGGRVTEDVLHSLAVSCAAFATSDVIVLHHTDCGMAGDPDALAAKIEAVAGDAPDPKDLRTISDPAASLEEDLALVRDCPWLPDGLRVHGGTIDVTTGEVVTPTEGLPFGPGTPSGIATV